MEAAKAKNARQSNSNAVKNLPRTQTGGNVFQNDGNVIIIGTVKTERTKSIVVSLKFLIFMNSKKDFFKSSKVPYDDI